jgi:hypothetical protein
MTQIIIDEHLGRTEVLSSPPICPDVSLEFPQAH